MEGKVRKGGGSRQISITGQRKPRNKKRLTFPPFLGGTCAASTDMA